LRQAKPFSEKIEIFDTNNNMQDISNYGKPAEQPAVDVSGSWNLVLEAMGQQIPVTLTLAQTDETVSGSMQSMFGSGEIAGGKVSGNKISATAQVQVQGQVLELNISGAVEDSRMEGSITVPMIPTPVSFSGTRS
jgi:hypothetical protein